MGWTTPWGRGKRGGARNRRAQSCWEEKQLLLRVQCSAGKSKITGWGNQDNSSGMGHSHGMAGVGPAGLGLGCNGILGHGQGGEEPWGGWLGIVRLVRLTCEQRMVPLKCEAWKRYGSEPFYKWWMREKKRKLYDFSVTIFNFLISTLKLISINLLTWDNYLYLDLKHNMLKHWYCIPC